MANGYGTESDRSDEIWAEQVCVREDSSDTYGRLRSHRDLRVWQSAFELVVAVYRATESFPASERFGLTSQIRRCAVSIPANIAEGYGRNNRGEYTQFLGIASGSIAELDTHILLAQALSFGTGWDAVSQLLERTGRQLTSLKKSLAK
jgi:four helix bundle protein